MGSSFIIVQYGCEYFVIFVAGRVPEGLLSKREERKRSTKNATGRTKTINKENEKMKIQIRVNRVVAWAPIHDSLVLHTRKLKNFVYFVIEQRQSFLVC